MSGNVCHIRLTSVLIAALLMTSSAPGANAATASRLAQCQAAYQEFLALPEKDIHAQIRWWQSQEPICSGTGLYEYFLGKLHLRADRFGDATRAFQTGLELDSIYEKELQLALGDVELVQNRTEEAEEVYRRVALRYPEWSQGHHALGLALWMKGELEPAIVSLERANELNQSAATFRILTMAYYSTGNYESSADALNRAYSLDESISGDRDPMVAGIRSYTELGKYEVARGLLAMLLRANPDIRSDEEFLKAGFYLGARMRGEPVQ